MKPIWHDNDNGLSEAELQAYVDGLLEGRRRAEVEAYLATTPAEADRLAAYRRQNIALHALFDPAAGEDLSQLPPGMARLAIELEAKLREPARARIQHRGRLRFTAAAALVLISAAVGWAVLDSGGWRDERPGTLQPAAMDLPIQPGVDQPTAIVTPAGAKESDVSQPAKRLNADPAGGPGFEENEPRPDILPEPRESPKET